MPRKKDPRRGEAKKRYLEGGGRISIAQLAEEMGVPNKKISKWKCEDKWEDLLKNQPRKRGGQRGNRNAAGRTPAKNGNRNAVTHGAYVNANEEDITPEQAAAIRERAGGSVTQLNEELQALFIRKAYLETQLKKYTEETPNDYHVDKIVHMVVPKTLKDLQREEETGKQTGEAADPEAGGAEKMKTAMKTIIKSSSFDRAMKIEAELNKLHGRILKALDSLKSYELEDRRIQIEERRLSIARQKLTGEIEIPDEDTDTVIDNLSDDD